MLVKGALVDHAEVNGAMSLITKSYYEANFVVTGGTGIGKFVN